MFVRAVQSRLPRSRAVQPFALLLAFCLVILAAIGWQAAVRVAAARDDAHDDAMRAADAWADRYAERTQRALQQIDQVSLLVRRLPERAARPGTVAAIAAGGHRAHGAGAVKVRLLDTGDLLPTDFVLRAVMLDARGHVVAATEDVAPANLSDREYFRWHRDHPGGELRVGEALVGVYTGRPIVPFTRRIDDAQGRFAGIVLVSVEPSRLTRGFTPAAAGGRADRMPERSAVSVLRDDGRAIAREAVAGAAAGAVAAVSPGSIDFGTAEVPTPIEVLRALGQAGQAAPVRDPVDRVERLLRYRDVPGYPLGVLVGIAHDALMAPYLRQRDRVLLNSFVAALAVLGFTAAIGLQMRRLQRMRREARREERFFRRVLDQLPFAITVQGTSGGCEDVLAYWNATAARTTGMDEAHAVGRNADEVLREGGLTLLHRESQPAVEERVAKSMETWLNRDGEMIKVRTVQIAIPSDDGSAGQVLSIRRDVTSAVNAARRLGLFQAVIRQASEGVVITDLEDRIVEANPAFLAMTGRDARDCVGRHASECGFASIAGVAGAPLRRRFADGRPWSSEIALRLADGSQRPCRLAMSAVRDERGAVTHYVRIASDISDLRASQLALERLALFDPLTGLRNRAGFARDIDVALQSLAPSALGAVPARGSVLPIQSPLGHGLAVIFVDLDDFKHVNDLLGHGAGDDLLQALATRLAACVHPPSTLYRLGGDEFLLMVRALDVRETATALARAVQQCLAEPVLVHGTRFETACSAGIAVYPDDGRDASELLRNADLAMYHAKQRGKNRWQYFDQSVRASLEERLDIERGLAQAIERGELALHYQPKVRIDGGGLVGFEALLRWHRGGHGDVSPARFVPIAERSDLILRLGLWVIMEACRQLALWREQGLEPVPVAVNVSARQLMQPEFAESVRQALALYRLPASLLQVEITEESIIGDLAQAQSALAQLEALGVAAAIDDFGTGHSSLSRLRQLRVRTLKIDRGFLLAAEQGAEGAAIYRAMLQLAASLGMQSVAEGVESCEQMAFLREAGCSQAQGWLVARPLPPPAAAAFVRQRAMAAGVRPVLFARLAADPSTWRPRLAPPPPRGEPQLRAVATAAPPPAPAACPARVGCATARA